MRNMLLALAAFGVVAFSTAVIADDQPAPSILQDAAAVVAPAAEAQPLPAQVEEAAVEQTPAAKPAHNHRHHYRRPATKEQNVFQRMLELERRKNAWLRRTFFGR